MFPEFERICRVPRVRRRIQSIAFIFLVVYLSAPLAGQGRYSVGVTADVTGGGSGPTLPGGNISQSPDNFSPYVGTYPSLAFKARGEHSSLDSTYGFGYDRHFTNPAYEARTHSATLAYSIKLGPKWAFNLADTFIQTSDISTYRLMSGSMPVPDQFQFTFTPVFVASNRNNTAT